MIVSVTANTTLDHTIFVPSFPMGYTTRSTQTIISLGGKPTDVSWLLGELGMPSLALGFAAGLFGQKVVSLLEERGVSVDFVWVGGETRLNTIIICADGSSATATVSTLEVQDAHISDLRERYRRALDDATCVVLGGTLPKDVPPSFYTDFIGMARKRGVPVVFDADEPFLSAGLAACPEFIKPNRHELGRVIGREIDDLRAAYEGGREVLARYSSLPVITLDKDGALAVLPDKAYFIPPLPVKVVSASGAGDGMLAGITAAVSRGESIEEGLRLGGALAGAICLRPGTADCRREDVERLLPQVQLIPYP